MIQNPLERRFTDFPLADVRVAIQMGTEEAFRVVRVKHADIVESQPSGHLTHSARETLFGSDIVPSHQAMASVYAIACWNA